MKNKISLPYLILIIAPLFLVSCGQVAKKNENNLSESIVSVKHVSGEKYSIDTKESVVTWKGSMPFPSQNRHAGYVYISKGELLIKKNQLVGGTIEVDMNTIEDKDHGKKNGLVDHLKSADFFDVERFSFSTFGIIMVSSVNEDTVNVTGNLTIKGITHPVTFPSRIEVKDGVVSASGKITIDRTRWDVRYKSGKFFDNLADGAISDNIEFEMKIVAKQ